MSKTVNKRYNGLSTEFFTIGKIYAVNVNFGTAVGNDCLNHRIEEQFFSGIEEDDVHNSTLELKPKPNISDDSFISYACNKIDNSPKIKIKAQAKVSNDLITKGNWYNILDEDSDFLLIIKDNGFDEWVEKTSFEIPKGGSESSTGGKKYDTGKLDYTLLPFKQLEGTVRVLEMGEKKYSRDNWKKVDKEKYQKALLRHMMDYANGELKDKESNEAHLSHIMCNCLFLLYLEENSL